MKPIPTDLKILNAIYDRYYDAFSNYDEDPSSRNSKTFVPIDIAAIAKDLGVDADIIFGRLYYHLENKYGYEQTHGPQGARVYFFALNIGGEHHCVHFPYLASVLADLQQENRKFNITATVAIGAFAISLVALLVSVLGVT